MNPKMFAAALAAACAIVPAVIADDGTPSEFHASGQDPWDCKPETSPETSEDGGAPSTECGQRYPADWFITQDDIDSVCYARGCVGEGAGGSTPPGCLIVGSKFGAGNPTSFGAASKLCGTKNVLGLEKDVGLEFDYEHGTPGDPAGRCAEIDDLFGGHKAEPGQIYIWCGEPDGRPTTTTPNPDDCTCNENTHPAQKECKGGSGQCMYSGKAFNNIFDDFCANYYQDTGECYQGFTDPGFEVVDCCKAVTTPTTIPADTSISDTDCPSSRCKSGEGPCIYDFTEDQSQGANVCLGYFFEGDANSDAKCYPNTKKCKDLFGDETVAPTPAPATPAPPPATTPDPTACVGENCEEYCDPDLCYGSGETQSKGPCRSEVPAPCPTSDPFCPPKYLCLPYVPGTDKLRSRIVYGDESTGPQCLSSAVKCKSWTTLSTSTSTTTTTTTATATTTTTSTTKTARKDPLLEEIAAQLNALVDAWEGIYCKKPADAELVGKVNYGVQANVQAVNEGMIRSWMTNAYHIEAQEEMHAQRLPEVVGEGAGEQFCAGPGELCECYGLARRSIVPAVTWGTFNCTAETFESVDNLFEPALNNADGNCYCTSKDVLSMDNVAAGKDLFELARQVGASRMCKANKASGVVDIDHRPPKFIHDECSKMCAAYGDIQNMGDLDEMMESYFGHRASSEERSEYNRAKIAELETHFAYIFRFHQKDDETLYNNFVVSAVSEGNSDINVNHQVYADSVKWAQYRDVLGNDDNAKFSSAASGFDSDYLAIGQRQASSTQTGCHEGGIKQVLGLCACTKEAAPTTTTATTITTLFVAPTEPASTTTTITTANPYQCVGSSGFRGPMVGHKGASELLDEAKLDTLLDLSVAACADVCALNTACHEFGYRVGSKVGSNSGSKCLLYNYEISKLANGLQTGKPYDHYFFDFECVVTTKPTTIATTEGATTAAATTTLASGVAKLSFKQVILGPQCLASTTNQIGTCESRCASQHECRGVFYFFEPTDTLLDCEQQRVKSIIAGEGDAFDRMAQCVDASDANNKDEECGCADNESCFPDSALANATYTCRPCVTEYVKQKKCEALYKLTQDKKNVAGVDAEPVKGCVMLTDLCDDASGDECLRYDLSDLASESALRSISLKKKVVGEVATTTPTSTATSTVDTTATMTAASSVTTTVTTTVGTTPSTTMHSTVTSTASNTGTTTPSATAMTTVTTTAESTVTTTPTATPITTVTTTESTTPATTVTSTATSTDDTSPTSTPTTTPTSTTSSSSTKTSTTITTTTGTSTTTTAPDITWKVVYETSGKGDGTKVGRRFGNAFKKSDRRFHLKYDGSKQLNSLNGAESACKVECAKDPLCLAIFAWRQDHHVAAAKRQSKKDTGFSCVGLTSKYVYENYFSYDNYMGGLTSAELSVALAETNYTILEKGGNLFEYPMLADDENGFSGSSRSTIKEFLWDANPGDANYATRPRKCKIGTTATGVYNGACKHMYTGFCMEEIPGTAQCLPGFEHAGAMYIRDAKVKAAADCAAHKLPKPKNCAYYTDAN